MNQCLFCDCQYPDSDSHCPVCTEPNPAWEERERKRLLEEPFVGYEAAWTGVRW